MVTDIFCFQNELKWLNEKNPRPVVTNVEVISKEPEIVYITDLQDVLPAVEHLCASKVTLAVDIETYPKKEFQNDKKGGLDPYRSEIRLLQFYDGSRKIFVFDLQRIGDIKVLGEQIWSRPMVAHNAVFELKHLLHQGVHPLKMGCTMLAANALLGGKLRSLKELAKEVLKLEISKEQQRSDWSVHDLTMEQIEYAAKDAEVTFLIFQKLHASLKKSDALKAYNLMRDTQLVIVRMELAGISFDGIEHEKLIGQWIEARRLIEENLRDVVGFSSINLNSGKQISSWIKDNIDPSIVENWPKTTGGQLQTGVDALDLFSKLPFVAVLKKYKELSKLLSTYGDSFRNHLNPVTARIHPSFLLGGTITGRLSCRDPNMQNAPRGPFFRNLFTASPGNVLVVADFSQIELRVAAIISDDQRMIQAFQNEDDLHSQTASIIMGINCSDVSKEQRQMAKAVNFGLLFGQGAKGLAAYAKGSYGVDMTEDEAQEAISAFFKAYPGIKQWQMKTARLAKISGKVETPCGRVRDFMKEENGYRYTEALNTPIQGGAAEIALHSLIRLGAALNWTEARIVNTVHDEIIVEVKEEKAKEVAQIVEASMIKGFLDVFPDSSLITKGLVEAKIAKSWGEAK